MLGNRQPLAEQVGETLGYVNEIFDRKVEKLKIGIAEKSATTVAGIITGVVLGILGLLFSVFGLVCVALYIAGRPELAMGFGIVSAGLLVLLLLIFLLRTVLIVNPAVATVINIFFGDDPKESETKDPNSPKNKYDEA